MKKQNNTTIKQPRHVWFTVDGDGSENILSSRPRKWENGKFWMCRKEKVTLPKGTIQHITGLKLTWPDGPIKWNP